ncbi:hypothetical protein [Lactobacillus amylovorus]|uniref:hypothetical protein n=1 Tax=Lactobacillus amylovorus TaxID=1604 RepID=UPI00232D308C|nr:hypothetical protein [Lactobacillus amylovorus]MDB6257016.1 hypothetical protein [Lactobacillus amylovorus]
MKYEGKNVYSSGEIADLLGFDDYHRVSNYLKKIGAKNVTKKGNTRYYSEKTKETVITYFKALEHKGSGESKKDQLIEELRTQLRTAQKESVDKLAEQKREYDSRLAEQKESYERLISSKDDDISNLKDTVTNLRKQQDIANDQIKELTTVTKQAQSLNLADKSPEQIKMLKGDAETSTEQSSSEKENDNQQTSESEKPRQSWWQRHFGRNN